MALVERHRMSGLLVSYAKSVFSQYRLLVETANYDHPVIVAQTECVVLVQNC